MTKKITYITIYPSRFEELVILSKNYWAGRSNQREKGHSGVMLNYIVPSIERDKLSFAYQWYDITNYMYFTIYLQTNNKLKKWRKVDLRYHDPIYFFYCLYQKSYTKTSYSPYFDWALVVYQSCFTSRSDKFSSLQKLIYNIWFLL